MPGRVKQTFDELDRLVAVPKSNVDLVNQVVESQAMQDIRDRQPAAVDADELALRDASMELEALEPSEPVYHLDNGVEVFAAQTADSPIMRYIHLEPTLLRIIRQSPMGTRFEVFGSQAREMLWTDRDSENAIMKTGQLLKTGDLDVYVSNILGGRIDEPVEALHAALSDRLELLLRENFWGITEGPFTVNRLVISLTRLSDGHIHVGFGETTNETTLLDHYNKVVRLVPGVREVPLHRAIQALVFIRRYAMVFSEDGAAQMVVQAALNQARFRDTPLGRGDLSTLRKLLRQFKVLKDVFDFLAPLAIDYSELCQVITGIWNADQKPCLAAPPTGAHPEDPRVGGAA